MWYEVEQGIAARRRCEELGEKLWTSYKELDQLMDWACSDIEHSAKYARPVLDAKPKALRAVKTHIEWSRESLQDNFTSAKRGLMWWLNNNLYKYTGTGIGEPGRTQSASDEWGKVATQLHALLEYAPTTKTDWEGAAADAYRPLPTTHVGAIDAVATAGDVLQKGYADIATELARFWISVEESLAHLLRCFTGAEARMKHGYAGGHTWVGILDRRYPDDWAGPEAGARDAAFAVVDVYRGSGARDIMTKAANAGNAIDACTEDVRTMLATGLPESWPGARAG